MRHEYLKAGMALFGMALGLSLTACDLSQVAAANDNATQPATAATIQGVWRTDILLTTTTPATDIKVTMEIDADNTMILSQRVATGYPAPNDFVEISKETWAWSIVDGKMVSNKTACVYKDPKTAQEIPDAPCAAPLTQEAPISVKGKAWTVVQNDQPIVFRKD
jgi:hypothetical protein